MQSKKNKYIFGPVPSRRLGYSLGVDVIPYKTCTYDCIYCQLGKTTDKTKNRQNFVPVKEIIKELDEKLETRPKVDYITLSGSGEPTLYSRLHELITGIKNITNIPVAVLTNGSLLRDKNVKNALLFADLVVPSLDAGSHLVWQKINAPVNGMSFEKMVKGLINFSNEYKNELWLEIFFVSGVNDSEEEIQKLVSYSKKIKYSKIQLNTIARPPYKTEFKAVNRHRLIEIAKQLGHKAEVISVFHAEIENEGFKATKSDISSLLKRRPCSVQDVAGGLNIHANEAVKYLDEMIKTGEADIKIINGLNYYYVQGE